MSHRTNDDDTRRVLRDRVPESLPVPIPTRPFCCSLIMKPHESRSQNAMQLRSIRFVSLSLAGLCAILMACAQQGREIGESRPIEGPIDLLSLRNLTLDEMLFTTAAYEREAFRLVLREANHAAQKLQLPETLPLTERDIVSAFIVPYGMTRVHRRPIGNVHTRHYAYFVSIDHKLSDIEHAHQAEACNKWRTEYTWPMSRLDTNGAYQLATQWLAALSMDVDGMNRDCRVKIGPNPYWNSGLRRHTFVPIYEVSWRSPGNIAQGYGDVVRVSLFTPTKTLISLNVHEASYILRDRVVFTNLNELLSEPEERTVAPPE